MQDVSMLAVDLLRKQAHLPIQHDRSLEFLNRFEEWRSELKNKITLFGDCAAARALISKHPGSIKAVVDLDPEKIGAMVETVPIVSFDEFRKSNEQETNIIITDIRLQYVYLDLIYHIVLGPRGAITVKGLWKNKVRYNYELTGLAYGNDPAIFDYEYLAVRSQLPMACTIPVDSIIRLMDCVRTSAAMEGDILEIGTGEGGSTYFMASVIQSLGIKKKIISVDGFESQDYIPHLNYETVSRHLACFPFVQLVKGYAPQILYGMQIERICFAFIDFYAFPDIAAYVYDRVPRGGIILIDNYNHGCFHNHGKPIADSFFADKKEKIIRVGGTQGLIVKQ